MSTTFSSEASAVHATAPSDVFPPLNTVADTDTSVLSARSSDTDDLLSFTPVTSSADTYGFTVISVVSMTRAFSEA